MHGTEAPSAWVQRWTHLIPPHATALDLACGAGRHMRWLKAQGLQVTGVDRSPEAIAAAKRATELGLTAYNILEGFEGDPDDNGQRGKKGGWRFRGLPWRQG